MYRGFMGMLTIFISRAFACIFIIVIKSIFYLVLYHLLCQLEKHTTIFVCIWNQSVLQQFLKFRSNIDFYMIFFPLNRVREEQDTAAFDEQSSSLIRLNNGTVLYLREVNKFLALVCILREDNFEHKGNHSNSAWRHLTGKFQV